MNGETQAARYPSPSLLIRWTRLPIGPLWWALQASAPATLGIVPCVSRPFLSSCLVADHLLRNEVHTETAKWNGTGAAICGHPAWTSYRGKRGSLLEHCSCTKLLCSSNPQLDIMRSIFLRWSKMWEPAIDQRSHESEFVHGWRTWRRLVRWASFRKMFSIVFRKHGWRGSEPLATCFLSACIAVAASCK